MAYKFYTIREIRFIQDHYEQKGPAWIADQLDRSRRAIGLRGRKMGLKYKGPKISVFEKGAEPWNKGMHYSPKGSEKGRFKKGDQPANTREPLKPYLRNDHGAQYWFIKTESGKIMPYHRFIWETAVGPIPKGYVVIFKDRDTMNLDLNNLDCISRAENIKRSACHQSVDKSKAGQKAWKTRDRKMRERLGLPVYSILILLTISILSACSSPHRIDYHRKELKLFRYKQYDAVLIDYYQHYRKCRHLPESIAADSAAVMITRVMVESAKADSLVVIRMHEKLKN